MFVQSVFENRSPSIINFNSSHKMHESKMYCVLFNTELGMRIYNWLHYFNNFCTKIKLDCEWKCSNLSKYLKGSALTNYIIDCLKRENYSEITKVLIEKFIKNYSTQF